MSIAYVQPSAPRPEQTAITAQRAYAISAIALTAALAVPIPDEASWWARPAIALSTYAAGALPVWAHTRLRPWLRHWLRD